MRVFVIVWLGQLVSLFGSSLTRFALGVWVYEQTGSTAHFAFTLLLSALPEIFFLPIAGGLADRWDRRRVMLLSTGGCSLCVLLLGGLLYGGILALWHLYLVMAALAMLAAIQWPAYTASISLLVPPASLARANGMVQFAAAAAQILAPMVAGLLLSAIGLHGLVLLDFCTFLFAMGTLLAVRFKQPPSSAVPGEARVGLLREARRGLSYILERPGLAVLLVFYALLNFNMGMIQTLITPLVLSFASPAALGRVMSIGGVGVLLGSLLMSVWGGPKRRVRGLLGVTLAQAAILCVSSLWRSELSMATAAFCFLFLFPIADGCSQTIWQSKVASELQGRVFAVRRAIAWSFSPLAYCLAGGLVDQVFEPLLMPGGTLASTVGWVMGVGAGRGTAFLLSLVGLFTAVTAISGLFHPRLRRLEDELPDMLPRPFVLEKEAVPAVASSTASEPA